MSFPQPAVFRSTFFLCLAGKFTVCVCGWGHSLSTRPRTQLESMSRCLCNTNVQKNCTRKPKNNSDRTSSYWLRASYCLIFIWCGGQHRLSPTYQPNICEIKQLKDQNCFIRKAWMLFLYELRLAGSLPSWGWELPGTSRAVQRWIVQLTKENAQLNKRIEDKEASGQ